MNEHEHQEHERQSLAFSIAQVRSELARGEQAGGDLTAIKTTLRWLERELAKLPTTGTGREFVAAAKGSPIFPGGSRGRGKPRPVG
jgi:hypothetical protein